MNTDRGQEVASELDLGYTLSDRLDILKYLLGEKGIDLVPTGEGWLAGFEVYTQRKPNFPGLRIPKGFTVKVRTSKAQAKKLVLAEVRAIASDRIQTAKEEEDNLEAKLWAELRSQIVDRASDPRSPLRMLAISLADEEWATSPTYTGQSGAHKWVPPLEWFPEELQNYPVEDLLTLWPSAEKDQLMLILGRIVAGATGTVALEGYLEHTARAYAFIVGQGEAGAGTGKSTFLNYLVQTLEALGYSTETINPRLGSFGWGKVARSDFAYIDDLTEGLQKGLLENPVLKSVVSNGLLKVEEKGLPAYTVRSVTTVICCTNTTNYAHYLGMDAGSISRLNQLDTFTKDELDAAYPGQDGRLREFWDGECDRLGVQPNLLMALVLRKSLDKFLEVTGHTLEDKTLVKDKAKDNLERVMRANREGFRIDVSLKHVSELIRVVGKSLAYHLSFKSEGVREEYLATLPGLDLSPDLVLPVLTVFCDCPKDKIPEELRLTQLSESCKPYLRPKLGVLKRCHGEKSLTSAFAAMVGELKSIKGFGYPSNLGSYSGLWEVVRRSVPAWTEQYLLSAQEHREVLKKLEHLCNAFE